MFFLYHHLLVLNLWHFILLLNINAVLKNVENQTVAGPQWLPLYFVFHRSKSTWTSNCLVTQILQNIFFCVQLKKEIKTGLGQHVSE